MRIALDARQLYRRGRRGIGKTLLELYRHLAALHPDWEIAAYHRADADVDGADLPPNVIARQIELPGDRLDAWQRWRLPFAAWHSGADVLHCPANGCPDWMPLPTVVTIHDLIPLDFSDGQTPEQVCRFEAWVRRACQSAAHVTCPSHHTRSQLIDRFGANEDRTTTIHWAPSTPDPQVNLDAISLVLARYNVSRPFVMHFGAADPRKNTARLLEAWATVCRGSDMDWDLLIVGVDDATAGKLARRANELGVSGNVRLFGFVPEADLTTLLGAADVLAYPSLSEGFGVPIFEAWTAETAVLTSRRPSLVEVAGSAAELIDPCDTDQIAAALKHLLTDTDRRTQLIRAGRTRSKQFMWEAAARRFAAVVEQAMDQWHRVARSAA